MRKLMLSNKATSTSNVITIPWLTGHYELFVNTGNMVGGSDTDETSDFMYLAAGTYTLSCPNTCSYMCYCEYNNSTGVYIKGTDIRNAKSFVFTLTSSVRVRVNVNFTSNPTSTFTLTKQ